MDGPQVLVKIWIFDDPIPKKGYEIIKIRKFFEEKGLLRSLRFLRLLRSMRLHMYLRPGKSLMNSIELR